MAYNYWQDLEEGKTYHLYNKAISNITIFKDDHDYFFFLEKYKEYFSPYLETYAYCLIPNHFHFLIKVKTREEILEHIKKEKTKAAEKYSKEEISLNLFLSSQFKRLFSSVSIRYKNKYQHQGAIFVKKLKKISINTEERLQYMLCYIHHNPIHHRLQSNYNDWFYSSYNQYIISGKTTFISKEMMLNWLGGIKTFHELHNAFKIWKNNDLNLE